MRTSLYSLAGNHHPDMKQLNAMQRRTAAGLVEGVPTETLAEWRKQWAEDGYELPEIGVEPPLLEAPKWAMDLLESSAAVRKAMVPAMQAAGYEVPERILQTVIADQDATAERRRKPRYTYSAMRNVTEDQKLARLAICEGCPLLDLKTRRCTSGGRKVDLMVGIAKHHCPEGLWGPEEALPQKEKTEIPEAAVR